jgi:hypothetical protein
MATPSMKSSASKLTVFKTRMKQMSVSLVTRLHKAQRILLRMYPGATNYQTKSVFDKTYLLHALLNS